MGRASRRFSPIGSPVSSQIAVGALLDARQRGVDLGDQLALAVARPQLQRAVGLGGGAVGEVGVLGRVLVQNMQRLAVLADDLFLPGHQLVAEIGLVTFVHEGLVLGKGDSLLGEAVMPLICGFGPLASGLWAVFFAAASLGTPYCGPSCAPFNRPFICRLGVHSGPTIRPNDAVFFAHPRSPTGSVIYLGAPEADSGALRRARFKPLFFQVKALPCGAARMLDPGLASALAGPRAPRSKGSRPLFCGAIAAEMRAVRMHFPAPSRGEVSERLRRLLPGAALRWREVHDPAVPGSLTPTGG